MEFNVIMGVGEGVILAVVLWLLRYVRDFVSEQRNQNERNREFMRSTQRSELMHYFRIVVEEGKPISPEEMDHIDATYQAYHANGGNGTGTLMYERIREHAIIKTKVES